MARVHKKIGSKERLLEMFENVNKVKVKEVKEDKPLLKEGYNEWGLKIKNSRINEDIDVSDPENFEPRSKTKNTRPRQFEKPKTGSDHIIDVRSDDKEIDPDNFNPFENESFDNPKKKDEKYLDKSHDNVQDNKYDDGTRYPVEKQLKVKDPSLEKMKGDDAPIKEYFEDPSQAENLVDKDYLFDLLPTGGADENKIEDFYEMFSNKKVSEEDWKTWAKTNTSLTDDDIFNVWNGAVEKEKSNIGAWNDEMGGYMGESEADLEGYDEMKRMFSLEDALALANHVYGMEGDENAFLEKFIADKQLTVDSMKQQVDKFLKSNRVVPDSEQFYVLQNLVTVLNDIYDSQHVRGSTHDPNRALNMNTAMGGGSGFGEAEEVEVEPEVEDGEFSPDAEFVDDAPPVDADPVIDDIPEPGAGEEEEVEGGLADGAEPSEFDNTQVLKGMEVEMEHTDDPKVALEIAMDHLKEIPDYYDHLEDMEAQATGAEASPEDAVDAMGDGQEGEAAEEITGDGEPTEKEVLWGKMDTIGEAEDFVYEPKRLGEIFGWSKGEKDAKALGQKIEQAKQELQNNIIAHTLLAQPAANSSQQEADRLAQVRINLAKHDFPTVVELLPEYFEDNQQAHGMTTIYNGNPLDVIIPGNIWRIMMGSGRQMDDADNITNKFMAELDKLQNS